MKTDELKITQDMQATETLLDKIEFIALYTGMSRRNAASMRLLSEELLAATKGILKTTDGILWMETSDTSFALHLRVAKPRGREKRDELIALSKSGKATLPKGLFSRLSVSLENYLLLEDNADAPMIFTDYSMYTGDMYGLSSMYMFYYYPMPAPRNDNKESAPADELEGIEKSIINAIVDDILVALQKDAIEIIAVKNLK